MTIMSEDKPSVTDKPAEEGAESSKQEEVKKDGEESNDFFSKITKNDITGMTNDLKLGVAKVDTQDEHGMTPLMHAAYRGNKEMCEILLDHVRSNHKNNIKLKKSK